MCTVFDLNQMCFVKNLWIFLPRPRPQLIAWTMTSTVKSSCEEPPTKRMKQAKPSLKPKHNKSQKA